MSEMPAATDRHAFSATFVPGTNNMRVQGRGEIEVNPTYLVLEHHVFSLFGISLGHRRREIALGDIVNVEQRGEVVTLRTRDGVNWMDVKLGSPEDAIAMRALLPTEVTPEFREQLEKEQQFHEHLAVVSAATPVTLVIIGLNVALFLVMLVAGAGLVETDPTVHQRFGSNFGVLTWTGQPWRLITSAFIHFGIIHLAFNMYALYGGRLTERLFGSARFALIYLLSAMSGSVVSGWWEPWRNSAGASGAIFGVYGALLVFFALRRADIPRDMLRSSGRGALTLCIYSLVIGATNPMVDNACHVGGLLGGALAAFFLVRPVDPAARATPRPWRLVTVTVGICIALFLFAAPLVLPNGSKGAPLRAAIAQDRFAQDEEKLVNRQQEILQAFAAKHLNSERAAERLENEVLGPWTGAMKALTEIPPIVPASSVAAQRLELLRAYVVARQGAMKLTIESLRHPDSDAEARSTAAWQRVNDLIEQVKSLPDDT